MKGLQKLLRYNLKLSIMKKLLLFLTLVLTTTLVVGQNRVGSIKTKSSKKPEQFNSTLAVEVIPVEELVNDFFNGTYVQVSNISQIGSSSASGFFWADQTSLGIPAGMIITSGNATIANGPNDGEGSGASNGGGNDPDLENFGGAAIYDASGVEFDFVSSSPVLSFNYVFGSDEYPEYGCSNFNDVFGFFVSGPGFNGNENVAIIPNTSVPVRINTINMGTVGSFGNIDNCTPPKGSLDFSSYYVDNPVGSAEIEYDGLTIPIVSEFTVIPGETYHAKLVVADAGDAIFDSGVFISFNSLCGDSVLSPKVVYATGDQLSDVKEFDFKSFAKYATKYHWKFGDGTESNVRNPGKHKYISEGEYLVQLVVSNYCCTDTINFKVLAYPQALNITFEQSIPSCHDACDGKLAALVEGGYPPYTYEWSTGLTAPYDSNLCKGIYIVTITDSKGTVLVDTVKLYAPDPIVVYIFQTGGVDQPTITKAVVSGGVKPYTFKWSDGVTTPIRTDLKPGVGYALKVTDKFGCYGEASKTSKQGTTVKFKYGFNTKFEVRELTISPYNMENTKAEIRVFNTMGQVMWNGTVTDGDLKLNTSNWSSGIYYVQMRSEEGVVQKAIFIK